MYGCISKQPIIIATTIRTVWKTTTAATTTKGRNSFSSYSYCTSCSCYYCSTQLSSRISTTTTSSSSVSNLSTNASYNNAFSTTSTSTTSTTLVNNNNTERTKRTNQQPRVWKEFWFNKFSTTTNVCNNNNNNNQRFYSSSSSSLLSSKQNDDTITRNNNNNIKIEADSGTEDRIGVDNNDSTVVDTSNLDDGTIEIIVNTESSTNSTIPGAQKGGGKKLAIIYTCTVCNTRSMKQFTEAAYTQGVVIVTCPGCQSQHLIADRLGYFKDDDVNTTFDIDTIAQRYGQKVQKVLGTTNQYELTLEDIIGQDKMNELVSSITDDSKDEKR